MRIVKNKFTLLIPLVVFFSIEMTLEKKTTTYSPILFFKENSLAFDTLFKYPENNQEIYDTTKVLLFFTELLKKDTVCSINIYGHSDKCEKKDYSKKRALKVYNFLLSKGVSKSRIRVEYFGSKHPYVSESVISNASNDYENKALRRYNRRVTFGLNKN